MGRTNGKLIPFLKEALILRKYMNLTYVSDTSDTEFYIELPRYEQNMNPEYETILKDWYKENGRREKYENYSVGKSVFQAALKKSLYLIFMQKMRSKLKYQFSSSEQIEVKRSTLKGKTVKNPPSVSLPGCLISTSLDNDLGLHIKDIESPPSIASSGYHSGSDDIDPGNFSKLDEFLQLNDNAPPIQVNGDLGKIEDIIKELKMCDTHLEHSKNPCSPQEFCMGEIQELAPDEQGIPDSEYQQNLQDISDEEFLKFFSDDSTVNWDLSTTESLLQNFPVTENLPAAQEMDSLEPVVLANNRQNIWLCTQKVQIGSLIELVCEPAIPRVENDAGIPETIIFCDGILEAGLTYDVKKKLRIDKYLLLISSVN